MSASACRSAWPYFVMELVRGIPITDYCNQKQVMPRDRLDLFIHVCQAVQHAHLKGIIHRDLKPSNVLVTLHDGMPVVKVIDFGVAKAMGQELTEKTLFTNFAQLIGTPLYMAPEQAALNGLDVDTRSDIYSLGVLLYELLTGTTPFDRERLQQVGYDEMRRIIREEEPPHPSTRLPRDEGRRQKDGGKAEAGTPSSLIHHPSSFQELDWIVMKALEKDRNRRYETASAFAADVERYLRDEPVQACPPSKWYRARKFARRNKAALGTATVVAIAVLLALGSLVGAVHVLAASNVEVKEEQKQTNAALAREKQANDDLLQAREREQQTLAFQSIALAERELAAGNIGRAEELLFECPPRLRGWEWHYLKRLPHDSPRMIKAGNTSVVALALSADGRLVATSTLGLFLLGELKLWDAATGKELHRLPGHLGPASSLAFSPDGARLTTAGLDGTITQWDAASGKSVRTWRGHRGPILAMVHSSDGKQLATASQDGTVKLWDAATGAEALRFQGHDGRVACIAFSPDGQRLASWGLDHQLRIWTATTGREEHHFAGHGGRVFHLDFHKDGRYLVSAGIDGLRLRDLETGREEWAVKGVNSSSLKAVFSPDGQRLVTAEADKTVKIRDGRTGQEILALRGHTDMVMAVAFSGNGRRLVSASLDGTVRLWNATPLADDPPPQRCLRGHQGQVLSLAFSADQRYLASAGWDGTAKLWDVASGKCVHSLTGHGPVITSVAFPAGRSILTTVSVDSSVAEWDLATGLRRRTLQAPVGSMLHAGFNVAFSADGQRFAALDKNEAVQVGETESGRELARVHQTIPSHLTVFLGPDGKYLAAASLGRVLVVDVQSNKTVASLSGSFHLVYNVAFSADGLLLAAAAWDGTVRVWDIQSGKTLHSFRHRDRVTCVAFHPNGRQLASGGCDNAARIWDLETGREIETLTSHIGYVMSLAYSPDGKLLATSSGHRYQGEVQLWETGGFGTRPELRSER
jgi:WD40 repeat protein